MRRAGLGRAELSWPHDIPSRGRECTEVAPSVQATILGVASPAIEDSALPQEVVHLACVEGKIDGFASREWPQDAMRSDARRAALRRKRRSEFLQFSLSLEPALDFPFPKSRTPFPVTWLSVTRGSMGVHCTAPPTSCFGPAHAVCSGRSSHHRSARRGPKPWRLPPGTPHRSLH